MPNRFNRVSSGSTQTQLVQAINQNFQKLDQETVTKKFGSGDNQVIIGKAGEIVGTVVGDLSKNAIIYGRYQPDRLGTLYINDGVPTQLSGQHPVSGEQGDWLVPKGRNVITELGGTW